MVGGEEPVPAALVRDLLYSDASCCTALRNYGVVVAMAHADEAPQETSRLTGHYANYCKVGYNAFEFVLDFGQYYPENGGAQFHTRIISNPVYTKALLQILGESIEQYEQTFGAIPREEE
jgi:hypothetical protein